MHSIGSTITDMEIKEGYGFGTKRGWWPYVKTGNPSISEVFSLPVPLP